MLLMALGLVLPWIVLGGLLRRYDFSPNAVLLLFGLTGVVVEGIYSNGQGFAEFGLWIFVCGLMVYLPAYSLPVERGAQKPRW